MAQDNQADLLVADGEMHRLLASPLRISLLAILRRDKHESYSLETLARKTGRLRIDTEKCLSPLVDVGLVTSSLNADGEGPIYKYRVGLPDIESGIDAAMQEKNGHLERTTEVEAKYFEGMIGSDEKMLVVFEMIHTVAKSDISALILGATGTGKELAAHAIHDLSPRARNQFHAINCASLPETLFEAELFGYEKGAFTSAHRRKIGRLELADDGTLFLDEIGELSIAMQVKLLRVIESRSFERLGGTQTLRTNFRLVCATNRSLEDMVAAGTFREDLYYRINVFPIRLPSLRERPGDIPILAREFLRKFCKENNLPVDARRFSDDAIAELVARDWPGNIRELNNVVQRAAVMAEDSRITASSLKLILGTASSVMEISDREPMRSLRDMEKEHVTRTLVAMSWNIKAASEVLGISRVTLYKKIRDYRLERA
ncbi:MAG: sigma-54 dependent transcriptional regulator [Acidobacteria bacterium]|nr:sigma-54 dependent transcriptional regulator [Acidobacteriota bacterium]